MYRLQDLDYMREALRLAAEGTALASPNPRVGAVVVNHDRVVGRGWHQYERLDHAEIVALAEAGAEAAGGTLYINLEPCCHQGRTGPCTEAIKAAGIARVVGGMNDPNPAVAGGGYAALAAAGVKVETDCLGREARRMNEDFAKWIRCGLPFVTLKAAVSLDGRIAAGGSADAPRWISSAPSRERVQALRHQSDAVLTGIGTAIVDDPLLTDRTKRPRRRPLLRVVLDSRLRLPVDSQLVKSARRKHDLLVLHSDGSPERVSQLQKAGARVEAIAAHSDGCLDPIAVLRKLAEEQILSVLLEAGSRLNGAMLSAGLVDKMILFQAPLLLGDRGWPLASGLQDGLALRPRGALLAESVGPDLMIETYLGE
ncbi:MAG TPA: bifunctional diaminohydroxyphosphoribosylaminopyrimidine deaminase/5-amino-6-(5-phosphoribosylamino)uracil reductase RibD [Terriglobales bacterium]|nr:bifunctional diaminohydroxyphosphoribosylaminopyrimidine deaminase/5-amino-6-(5-phosphoribosylamino)uracil reductase RibD [Terriglobales bacterium]